MRISPSAAVTAPALLLMSTVACAGPLETQASSQSVPRREVTQLQSLLATFGTKGKWTVRIEQSAEEDADMGDVPAQVCFSTTSTSGGSGTVLERVGSGATLPYQTAEVKIVTSNKGNSVVVVEATFSGGGSGLAREVSLWVYDAPGDSFQRAFRFELSELGFYQVVTSGPLTGYIMASDGIWLIGDEGHFDEHHFTIRLLGRPWNGSYREVLPYVTTRKYDRETADASVLNAEAPTIGRPLGLAYPPNGLP